MQDFDLTDLNPVLPDAAKASMLELILAWAKFDVMLTQWLIVTADIGFDTGTVLIGNMDTRAKLDRLVSLYTHFKGEGADGEKALKYAKDIQSNAKKFADLRNEIAHAICSGVLHSDADSIVFSSLRLARKGSVGSSLIKVYSRASIDEAARFANETADRINANTAGRIRDVEAVFASNP